MLNELFDKKRQDENVKRAMAVGRSKFKKLIDKEDLDNICLISLWRLLKDKGDFEGLIPFLVKNIRWECCKFLSHFNKGKIATINILETVPDIKNNDIEHIIFSLNEQEKSLIRSVFVYKKTLREIAFENNCSHECVNLRLNKTLEKLKKVYN